MTLNAPPHILRTVAECLGTFAQLIRMKTTQKQLEKLKKTEKYDIYNT